MLLVAIMLTRVDYREFHFFHVYFSVGLPRYKVGTDMGQAFSNMKGSAHKFVFKTMILICLKSDYAYTY